MWYEVDLIEADGLPSSCLFLAYLQDSEVEVYPVLGSESDLDVSFCLVCSSTELCNRVS